MPDNQEKRPVELRSEEVNEILGRVPGWITRNGIMLFLLIILMIILGSWFYRFPDVKNATITVTSIQPPADVKARSDGKIEELLVEDNEQVKEGKVLAVIENAANFKDVITLRDELEMIDPVAPLKRDMDILLNTKFVLGPVQSSYATFYKNYRDYAAFLELDYHYRKIELQRKEMQQYFDYSTNLNIRAQILQEEYLLSRKQFGRDSLLFLENVVSESNFETSKSEMLSKRNSWQEIVSLKAENEISIARIEEQILEMELKQQEQDTGFATSLEESLNKLKASIASWEKSFLIIAPVSGDVTFNRFWSENQNVKNGEKVMTIIPEDAGSLIGKKGAASKYKV